MAQISKKTALLWVVIVAAAFSIWRFIWQPLQEENSTPATTTTEETLTPTNPPTPTSQATPQGEEATSEKKTTVRTSYKNPGGEDEVAFSLSVNEAGVITTASVEVLAKNPTSKQRQSAFAAGLPQAIQGKKLSELTAIDKVGGSSLTTASFNASLAALKAGI